MQRTLVWFRNDLRVHDNEPLYKACKSGKILALYCFDPRKFGETSFGFPKTGSFRAQFLIESVSNLRERLRALGGNLIIRIGKPEDVIPKLVDEYNIDRLMAHKEITYEELRVEEALENTLNIPTEYFWGSTLYHIDDISFNKESLPDVFTSFRKEIERNIKVRALIPEVESVQVIGGVEEHDIPKLNDLGLNFKEIDKRSTIQFKGGESEALKRVDEYIWTTDLVKSYKYTRNGMLGSDYSTKFSPWLANGAISPRKIYWEIKNYEDKRVKNDSTYWVIFELIWRDYFRLSAWKHGNKIFFKGGIHQKERDWRYHKEDFFRWANGETGIPFIDANMRELNESGFMSNRGRQNVASFLSQNLNIDWRMGAEYFESLLLDYDPCSNYGNWAYNATVGHDPRNRYFNILNQANRYDKNGEFVRHWLPELIHLPSEFIHEPNTLDPNQQKLYDIEVGIDYPKPMIDLEFSYDEIKQRG